MRRPLTCVLLLICMFSALGDLNALHAAENPLELTLNGIVGNDVVLGFKAHGVFSQSVMKFLNRGFTVKMEYRIELWRRHRFWFDHLDAHHNIEYQIDFEPLERRYTCLESREGAVTRSKLDRDLQGIITWSTCPDPYVKIVSVSKMDKQARYYYNIELVISTVTTENMRRLRERLREFGQKKKQPSTLTRTAFRIATDFLSSRNRKKYAFQSKVFSLRDLPILAKE